ncbi:hypothetical protein [Breoghania sp. L-A4]|nr:hypothetical protein [Breoghania sp. L-A4]
MKKDTQKPIKFTVGNGNQSDICGGVKPAQVAQDQKSDKKEK